MPADLLAQVAERINHAYNLADLAGQIGAHERDVRRALVQGGYPLEYQALRDVMAETHPAQLEMWDCFERVGELELIDQAHLLAEQNQPVKHNQHYSVQLPDDLPYLLVFTGDWHLGESGVNYKQFKRDIQLIRDAKQELGGRVRVIAMGDYIGGYMRSKTPGTNHQVLTPAEQRLAAKEALSMIDPEVIIQGDHDEWHTRQDDQNEWLSEFCTEHVYRFAQWGCSLEFRSPASTTRVLARHRFSGSRKANSMGPQKLLHQNFGPADITALAHFHSDPDARFEKATRIGEPKFVAVQSGTYKVFDDYAKKLGVGNGEYGVPCVLVFPDAHEQQPFPNLADGVAALKAFHKPVPAPEEE